MTTGWQARFATARAAGVMALATAAVGSQLAPAASAASQGCASPAGAAACAGIARAPFLTPAQARRAVAALWTVREHALRGADDALLSRIETGSMGRIDRYRAAEERCCFPKYWTQAPRPFLRATIFLPRQTAYPLAFAAEVVASRAKTTTPGETAMFVLTRAGPSKPWRFAVRLYDVGYAAPAVPYDAPTLDAQGYLTPPRRPADAPTRRWFPMLVSYFEGLKRTGAQPASSPFLPGHVTSLSGLEQRPNGYSNNGVTAHYRFAAGGFGGPWLFNAGGAAMLCGDLVESVLQTPTQPYHRLRQSRDRTNWGPTVAPGLYASITSKYDWAVCIVQRSNGLSVAGAYPASGFAVVARQ